MVRPVRKAFAKITDDVEERGVHTFRPSTDSSENGESDRIYVRHVRNRGRITRSSGSRAAGIAMAHKLIEAAQSRRRAVNAPHLVALVRAGAKFEKGKLVERPMTPPLPWRPHKRS